MLNRLFIGIKRENTIARAKFALKPARDMAKQRVVTLHAVYVVDEFEPFYINTDYVKQTVVRRRQELGAFFAERGFIESAGELVLSLIHI